MAQPSAASSRKWILVALAASTGCCCLGAGATALVGLSTASDGALGSGADAPEPGDGDDDAAGVLFQTAQGTFVAQAQVVAQTPGLPPRPEAVWKEDKTGFALQLSPGGHYVLVYQANGPSGGVGFVERGQWQASGPALVLAPSELTRSSAFALSDTPGVRSNVESEALAPGPARTYRVAAAAVDFVANWESPAPVARKEGLVLQGPPPPGAWTGGAPLEVVLRRARLLPPH